MDRRLSGCLKPNLLPPAARLQGYAVIEKRDANRHLHFLIACRNAFDQFLTGLSLFAALDTVPEGRNDPRDDFWQRDAWEYCTAHGLLTETGRTRKTSPLLARYAPGGTATVQMVRNDHDRKRVCQYITKELGRSSLGLATANDYWAGKSDFLVRELREFHSATGRTKPASCIRKDPQTGDRSLNLDDANPWRWGGKRVR